MSCASLSLCFAQASLRSTRSLRPGFSAELSHSSNLCKHFSLAATLHIDVCCFSMLWSSVVQYSVCEFEGESSLTAPIYVLSISILPQHHISMCASSRFFSLVWCSKVFANFKRRVLSQLQHMLVYQSCRNYNYIYSACVSSQCYDPVWRKIVIAVLKGDFWNISNLCMFINPALTLHIDMCFFSKLWSSFV
jgi:hypothetical protein